MTNFDMNLLLLTGVALALVAHWLWHGGVGICGPQIRPALLQKLVHTAELLADLFLRICAWSRAAA